MKLTQIHEAAYADQITGIYLVTLFHHYKIRKVKHPIYDKNNKVLLVLANKASNYVKIAVFGSNPYERLKRFVDQYFDEQLDDMDFGVSTILDRSRDVPQRNFNPEVTFKQIYRALKRAKQI
ncbi:hypothetical protein LCGC14_2249790 [marine sediment metagenome]|uniref:Uncharacterized protein n=1 Tax=marine sediment metagenome TaxID=412755 RepID=A0A0F9FFG9_9ZZZZ